ncbi:aldo/keto reductase [Paraburkholderia sp. MMS20-SJTR3]|uniref:Aldo/keto reductase n=1 Tax=Paraburkholderia sejongensis TaxID=2886946 RepID=A0ABS8JZ83_9BURK|nr:aldo/keto reductase [Paraburkholderia sp. MMS20-SJTR3]MCC8395216.1 aldo/keto reductase [Paraburkholderia sp. MMS20-SJTR3]
MTLRSTPESRRRFLRGALGVPAALALPPLLDGPPARAQTPPDLTTLPKMNQRVIPASGERLPVIGCGTWRTFDVGDDPNDRARLADVLRVLFAAAGSVIDSSPMYGSSEAVAGALLTQLDAHRRAFVATKVWTDGREAGIAQMEQSFERFQQARIDLMQIHNLRDWRTQIATLRAWKAQGRIRYIGITHYTSSAFDEVAAVMRSEKPDFVQINYAADDRAAEQRILPLAAQLGIGALINQPFGGGGLLARVMKTPLPAWAGEIECTSWAQLLLKFVLAHPAVTVVIPGTGRPQYMADNVRAGSGPLPDAAMRARIVAAVNG